MSPKSTSRDLRRESGRHYLTQNFYHSNKRYIQETTFPAEMTQCRRWKTDKSWVYRWRGLIATSVKDIEVHLNELDQRSQNWLILHYNFAVFGFRSRYTQIIYSVNRICGMSRSTLGFSFFVITDMQMSIIYANNCAFGNDRHVVILVPFTIHIPSFFNVVHTELWISVFFVLSLSEQICKWGICASSDHGDDRPRGLCLCPSFTKFCRFFFRRETKVYLFVWRARFIHPFICTDSVTTKI